MNIRFDPLVGAVDKGKTGRHVTTRSRNGRERWIVPMPDRRDAACPGCRFSHCGLHVGHRRWIECEKYDALRVELIRLSLI